MVSAMGSMDRSLKTLIRDLHRRRGRERRGLVLAEGVRLVEEALATRRSFRAAVASATLEGTSRGRALKAALQAAGVAVTDASDAELASLAATETPQGIVAVLEHPISSLNDIEVGPRSVIAVLDGLQDPGNVGTIVRTAHALGAAGVIALPGTAELANPKTLRATMGAAFRIPIVPAPEADAAAWLARRSVAVVATGAGGEPFDPVQLPRPLAIVLGSEGAGARSALAAGAVRRITIPLVAGAESLNVAAAAAILLYGATRER
jgi:TrmH family RNA methyltransferase